jgi:hypothetical protein
MLIRKGSKLHIHLRKRRRFYSPAFIFYRVSKALLGPSGSPIIIIGHISKKVIRFIRLPRTKDFRDLTLK